MYWDVCICRNKGRQASDHTTACRPHNRMHQNEEASLVAAPSQSVHTHCRIAWMSSSMQVRQCNHTSKVHLLPLCSCRPCPSQRRCRRGCRRIHRRLQHSRQTKMIHFQTIHKNTMHTTARTSYWQAFIPLVVAKPLHSVDISTTIQVVLTISIHVHGCMHAHGWMHAHPCMCCRCCSRRSPQCSCS